MSLVWLTVLAAVGVACITVGVAFIYWPAAFIVAGVACLALAFVVEVDQ